MMCLPHKSQQAQVLREDSGRCLLTVDHDPAQNMLALC